MAYSPLGRGLLTGNVTSPETLGDGDFRKNSPRFQGDNLKQNLGIVAVLEAIAREKKAAPAQVALAWLLHQGPDIVPIPGTKRRKWLEQNAAAADLKLTPAELNRLAQTPPAAGERYADMRTIDRG